MPQPSKIKVRTRYSIAEWYSANILLMDAVTRRQMAAKEVEADVILGNTCPFHPRGVCNKKGGVCTLRMYRQEGNGPVEGTASPVCVCPSRFFEGGMIHRWVGETILGTPEPLVLTEIGFLNRLRPETEPEEEDPECDMIGRIDNVLLHPNRQPLDWCALETQAVYFSGKAMSHEFKLLAGNNREAFPFPAQHRRPDWRSSGPKRLLPQLQTQDPHDPNMGEEGRGGGGCSFF